MSDATHCQNHPDRPSAAQCQKYSKGLCLECLENDPHCADPDIYCKFREQCVIFYHHKKRRRAERQQGAAQ